MKQIQSSEGAKVSRRRFLRMAGLGGAAALIGKTDGVAGSPQTTPGRKVTFPLGLASYSLRKFGLAETLAMTRRVGLEFICLKSFHLPLDSDQKTIAETASRVKKAGITLYGGGVIQMSNEAQVQEAFEYAKAAGMRTIVGVPLPPVLPVVSEMVKRYDIAVAIHNHGPGDKTYPTPESAYEKIKDLDKRIGLCIDIGHTLRVGADPIESAERCADRVLDVHIKDVSEASPKGKELEIGRGVIDIPRFLRTLIRIKYAGVVSFEYEKDPTDPLAGLAESVGFVRGALRAIVSSPSDG